MTQVDLDETTPEQDAGSFSMARADLAAAIRRGDYAPNQRLVETELTASLGVSRGTIRSVFIALEQENYISLERNRGARVRQFSPDEAVEMLETRAILESAAAGLAAERITADELDALQALVADLAAAETARDGEAYTACYRALHAQIIAASKQPTLIKAISAIPYPLVMSQYRDARVQHPRRGSLDEQEAILSALRIGSRSTAEAAMRHHVEAARLALTLTFTAPAGYDTA